MKSLCRARLSWCNIIMWFYISISLSFQSYRISKKPLHTLAEQLLLHCSLASECLQLLITTSKMPLARYRHCNDQVYVLDPNMGDDPDEANHLWMRPYGTAMDWLFS